MQIKFICPCCGYKTLDEEPPGKFDICPVCYWEDDWVQYDNPDYEEGTNHVSLNQARENFAKYGVSDLTYKELVRFPLEDEI